MFHDSSHAFQGQTETKMIEALNTRIGHQLRKLRQMHNWSLEQASRETGVSKAMLGQIERGESSPTLQTLWKIAGGFERSLSELLPTELLDDSAGTDVFQSSDSGITARTLFAYDPQLGFEQLALTLPPHSRHTSVAHQPGVIEVVNVIEGTLELEIGDSRYRLRKGENLRFTADQPHSYHNGEARPLLFYNLVCYPPASRDTSDVGLNDLSPSG